MSIKDLFGKSTNYVSETNQKDAFADTESSRNVKQIVEKQNSFEPQIDYTDPQTFAKYGSAEMYYKSAIDRILDFYPYDGSDAEYNNFYNKSLDIEKFIFNTTYPRTNGFVDFKGTSHISLKGGPHTIAASNTKGLFKDPQSSQRETANIYDEDIYTTEGLPSGYGQGTRESNLKCDFQAGVSVEFWLSSSAISSDNKQAIFHITGSGQDDELTIFLSGTTGSPFHVRLKENSLPNIIDQKIGTTPTTSSILGWNHYALTFKSASAGITSRLYVNGALDAQANLGSRGAGTFEQSGSLGYVASGSATETLLNGAMDEFRFWKVERTAQDIGRNWFGQVRGGSNTDISNTTLGVYYKFNEGITGIAAQDSVVLDYSGRVSNGTFTGYTSTTRNTGSAIVLASAAAKEYLDPIIYANHPDVSALRAGLLATGSIYDSNNNASIGSMMPSWVIDEHESGENNNFKFLMHIVGSYFDKIRLQIAALPDFKTPVYTSSSFKALPFAEHLPASLGLETPQIFVDADVLERFVNRSETENYKFDLNDTKNLIYLNLYNNLTYLFKSKGTHKAVRNVLRAFNIDDKLVRFNTYANNFVYDLENNLQQTTVYDSAVNFNNPSSIGAVVYSTASADSTQLGYISSSNDSKHEDRYGFTLETDVVFPKFIRSIDTFDRNFITASLFGIHSASADSSETTIFNPSIYVFAEREQEYSKNIRFRLSSSLLSTTLTSSNFLGAYNDNQWNLSVRLRPDTFGLTGSVAGVSTSNYILEFTGYNQLLGEIRESFTVTGSVATGSAQDLLHSPKRIYVGAQRTDVTGSLINKTDVLVSAVRFWNKNLDDVTLKQHAFDFENYGIKDSNKHLSPLDNDNSKTVNSNTLVLNYDFSGITTSDTSGEFTVTDISSGSVENRTKFGKLGEISSYLYPAKGKHFGISSKKAVIKKEMNLHQFIDPEKVINDNLVKVRTEDDKLFDTLDTIPNYHYLLEKSMYAAISEEMLNFFAGVVDFHGLIGHPVNQYRMNYKGLEKLREAFFRRVTEVSEVEKFVDYYKWFDDSVSQIIGQLIPASADYTQDILNTIESHTLERNKYQHRIPMMAFTSSTEGVAFGSEEMRYNWNRNHAPVSGLQRENSNWWKERAEREGVISSGDAAVDAARTQIRNVATNQTNGNVGRSFTNTGAKYTRSNFKYRTLSRGQVFESKVAKEIKGGVNFEHNKDVHYTHTALHPAGPVNQDSGVFVPRNVLVGFTEDLVLLEDTADAPENPSAKVKRNILVQHGRDWEGGVGYKSVKSSFVFPFNIVSSSVRSGYNAEVIARVTASIEVTNVHNDVYGPDMERPMQGPFTDYAVGGHQSRHIKLNTGGDNYLNRPEAWKILLGKCSTVTGAIGMVGADYPYPEANAVGENPYPMTGAQKATYYRDQIAKRPVNIRNIEHKTGSTILGNYDHNYQVVHTVGGYSNPRAFIDQQPTLPAVAEGADAVKTILDLERGQNSHFVFVDDYNDGYLTGSGNYKNKTVILSRFSAPGGIESMTNAFKDFRSGDFSVYNTIPFRNMTVRRPFQGVTSSIVPQNTGIRNFDHTGRAFGFTNLAARHAGKFFRDSAFQTNPGASDNASEELASFHKTHRNTLLLATSESCREVYDNLNIQHQIPRSDRQYSWITASIIHNGACEPRYSGFMQTDSPLAPYYEITGNYFPFFDYVSASAATSGIYQNTTRLNLLVLDKTGSTINTLGEPTISGALQTPAEGERLNALLIRRGDTYGWNWRAFHQKDHPILDREHKENLLTALKNQEIKQFRLPPVSMKGRPVIVNMDVGGENVTLKATHNNEKIYFNERELNDLVFQTEDPTITPFDQLINVAQDYSLNWVRYSETLFPSTRNEFSSGSRERLGFDNGFWRGTEAERLTLGSESPNSLGQNPPASVTIPDRSSWALDKPLYPTDTVTFFNRTVSNGSYNYSAKGAAGELQNNDLFLYAVASAEDKLAGIRLGPLYSRKQDITSPNSVASRAGFAQTASLTNTFTDNVQLYGGEAAWEAGVNATISVKSSDGSFTSSSHPSEPWFDEYGDFKEELLLAAKDYSVIPEFRISEHISEYSDGGIFNKSNFDTFEIPGTTISSSQQNFYKDYSNSDFLREFANIREKSGLNAKEIMLTCKAAVRFNPYEGFYPAQRTLDLVSQFSSSFAAGMNTVFEDSGTKTLNFAEATNSSKGKASAFRPLIQPLFAPGILYNSIKSGIAVDYPIVNTSTKISSLNFSGSGAGENWSLQPSGTNIISAAVGNPATTNGYTPNFAYWDLRVPFETMIEPAKYIDKISFLDFEPSPSASINATASLDASVSDGIYELMARNFFGQTGDFFLKDSSYTKIQSDLIQDGLNFKQSDVFAARLKIRKSHNGKRFYNNEKGFDGTNSYFTPNGATGFVGNTGSYTLISGSSFPLPQDPARNSDFKETFTMYSRPTAFGPSIAGRPTASYEQADQSGSMDSLEGFNWAYTPPYYHGESWVDFIFRPAADKTYTLEDILSETEAVYWRVDPGAPTGSIPDDSPAFYKNQNLMIQNGITQNGTGLATTEIVPIYGGSVINKNAMQLDSSLNLFGVERVPKRRKDKFGNTILDENELAGKRWVIQPKWETPMLNFAEVTSTNNNITYPTNFSESVPRGMWHQFGKIPTDTSTGVFMEIGDIPSDWLKYHYDVVNMSSSYNNNDPAGSGSTAYLDYQSLTDLFGFQRSQKKDSAKVRLGEIADKREVYEAVVAIPYIVEANEDYSGDQKKDAINRKKFVSIPRQRFDAALLNREGSKDGDSLETAGESIRKMVQKMKRYVLPPQFDFINFDEIDPVVMYFFEFKYEFDKDDLSYIWQNLAPRDYKKITFQEASVSHDLMNTELLEEQNIIDNPNLRWMVFKVKQKATKDYYDLIPPQIKAARPTTNLDKPETDKDDEYLQFNWPYDYLSFVELVKLEADVLYKDDPEEETE